jgi:Tol biopolymer transport system component
MDHMGSRRSGWMSVGSLVGLGVLAGCAGPGSLRQDKQATPEVGSGWATAPVTRLTDSSADQVAPSWSADGQSVVYQNNSDGNWELYLIQLADGRPQRLTNTPEAEEDPSLSPDGRWLVCTVHEPSLDADPPRDILLLSQDGRQRRVLASHGSDDWYPRFTADGSAVVFVSDRVDERRSVADEQRSCALFRVDLGTGQVDQLGEAGSWSAPLPVADRVGIRMGAHSLGWWSAAGVSAEVVDSSRFLGQPDWNERTGWVSSELAREQDSRLLIRTPGTATWIELPRDDRDADGFPAWSPDGTALAFAGRWKGQWDLFIRRSVQP